MPETKSKKGSKNTWRLVDKFVENGPESTTRYRRKEPNFKRPRKSAHPAPQRQASGAKGGQAARKAAEQRRSARLREAFAQPHHFRPQEDDLRQIPHALPYYTYSPAVSTEAMPSYRTHPNSPYPDAGTAFSQSFPASHATIPTPEQFLQHQQQLITHGKHQDYSAAEAHHDRQFAATGTYTPPHDPCSGANTPPWPQSAFVDKITLADLGDKPLFASSCDGSDSASEMNFPQTPSTMGSAVDGFPSIGSGVGIDPSPY